MAKLSTASSGHRASAVLRVAARLAAAGALAVTLAGCMANQQEKVAYPNDYRLRHPITIGEGNRSVEVFLGRNRGGLSPQQRADVLAFAQAWKRESTGGIVVEVPSGGGATRSAADSLREIHSIFAASAVPRGAVAVRTYALAPTSVASIKLNYSKVVATAGPCGLWPFDLGPSDDMAYIENKNYYNLGCASQRNLAAMVDNPSDLVQPRGETPAYMGRRSIALDKYRKGESPSGTYPSDAGNGYDTGKISDLGK